jgi:hypothetical protein
MCRHDRSPGTRVDGTMRTKPPHLTLQYLLGAAASAIRQLEKSFELRYPHPSGSACEMPLSVGKRCRVSNCPRAEAAGRYLGWSCLVRHIRHTPGRHLRSQPKPHAEDPHSGSAAPAGISTAPPSQSFGNTLLGLPDGSITTMETSRKDGDVQHLFDIKSPHATTHGK